jgi:ABC-type transporter Mla MlaB component
LHSVFSAMAAPLRRRTIVCDLAGAAADAGTVDALARLQLAARRAGVELRLRHVPKELRELLAFTGLSGVLRLEPVGKAEEREELLRVEEERDLADPAV